uniref:N-acetylaspartate synthetase n=1 Tax=Eptatretus burgeri TaxID=7764 RepID=A0A8C4R4G4_EPTBU
MRHSPTQMVCETWLDADGNVPHLRAWQQRQDPLIIREFEAGDEQPVRSIFRQGILERAPNAAIRGLREQPRVLFLYGLITVGCLALTGSTLLTLCAPCILLGLRYHYSQHAILNYVRTILDTDLADISKHYMKRPGCCFWVAVFDSTVVGMVAVRDLNDGSAELCRMSVDPRFRGRGIAKALGHQVIEFAVAHGFSAIVLSTTAVKRNAHHLYRSLGFVEENTNSRSTCALNSSGLQRMFFQLRHYHYRLQLTEE